MGSKAKDASSKVHERNQTILADLLRDEDNRYCADCMAKGERNRMIFGRLPVSEQALLDESIIRC